MSEAILLKTMSRKSVFQIGKYTNHSVQQIIDLRHTQYLRWVYFNMSMISFLPDILDEIGIWERDRIQKPGTDKEMHKKVEGHRVAFIMKVKDKAKASKQYRANKKINKIMQKGKEKMRRISKSQMQAKNHGK